METTGWEKYYYAGSVRLAMREDSDDPLYLISDHLGSTSLVLDTAGLEVAKRSYLPFGETWGVSATGLPTDYTYTGQREAPEIGLHYYVARWYDSEIGHFTQPDSVVPGAGDALVWDRYAYVQNNPIKYADPSGHMVDEDGSYNPWKKTVSTDEGIYDLEDDVWIVQNIKLSDEFELIVNKRVEYNFTTYGGTNFEITFIVDDVIDFYIDLGGISGDIIAFITALDPMVGDEIPGGLIYFLTEGMEAPGITKAIYDVFQGDPSNLIYEMTTSQIEDILETNVKNANYADYGRISPGIGFLFNLISLYQNIQMDINISFGRP